MLYLSFFDLRWKYNITIIISTILVNTINATANALPAITPTEEVDCVVTILGVDVDISAGSSQIPSLILFKGTGHVGSNVTRTSPLVTLAPFNTQSSIHDTI